jgi:ArsR family transcriptional regulator, arsenate/arsenite/antimonite-responsive transcriptional repressor
MSICCAKNWLKFFKAACDEQRQMILEILRHHKSLNASQIIKKMKLSQPTVSHHLKVLHEASIIDSHKKGKEVFYSINTKNISSCCTGFKNQFCTKSA